MSELNSTVIVGCKLPNGLHLDLRDKSGDMKRVTLAGANDSRIVGGYGLTSGVSSEFMTEWFKKNAKHPAVVNSHVFIHSDAASAVSMAKERREVATGLEAIDPVKRGMLRNEQGAEDVAALKLYNQQKAQNPARNAQIVE